MPKPAVIVREVFPHERARWIQDWHSLSPMAHDFGMAQRKPTSRFEGMFPFLIAGILSAALWMVGGLFWYLAYGPW